MFATKMFNGLADFIGIMYLKIGLYALCTQQMLSAIVGVTSHIKIFLIFCIQSVLCMDFQFMKVKGYVTTLDFSKSHMDVFSILQIF